MATHQSLSGRTDSQLLQGMVSSYEHRYNDAYWAVFDEHVRPTLGPAPVIVDLGCGPGLLLQDISRRIPGATLHGYDVTTAMIDHAKTLDFGGEPPALGVLDLATAELPLADGSVDVAAMTAVLHLFEEPFTFLARVRRALKPNGRFLLYDWVRTPLPEYLDRRAADSGENQESARRRALKLFPVHNRYTADDWRWVLAEAGFQVLSDTTPRDGFHHLFAAVAKDAT